MSHHALSASPPLRRVTLGVTLGVTLTLAIITALAFSLPSSASAGNEILFDSLSFVEGVTPVPIDSPSLTSSELVVGSPTVLQVSYITPDLEFPYDYRVGVSFPQEFGFGPNVTAEFDDNSPAPDPDLREIQIIDHTVIFRFRRTFFAPQVGQTGVITIHGVTLPTEARAFEAAVFISDIDYVVLAGPGITNEIALEADEAVSISIQPDTALTLQAGQTQSFTAAAQDQYGNAVAADNFEWRLQDRVSLGEVTPGSFFATTTGQNSIIVEGDLAADTSGLITVTPGELADISIRTFGLIYTIYTGGELCDGLVIVFSDDFGNRKTDLDPADGPLRIGVSDGSVSPREIVVNAPITNGIIDLADHNVVFSDFIGVTHLRASYGNTRDNHVRSLAVALEIAGAQLAPPPGEEFPVSLPAGKDIRFQLSVDVPPERLVAVDSIKIGVLGGEFVTLVGPYSSGDIINSGEESFIALAGSTELLLTSYATFKGAYYGRCSSVFTRVVPVIISELPLTATPKIDTLLTGHLYESYDGFGFTSQHSFSSVLGGQIQTRTNSGAWLTIGLISTPISRQEAANDKINFRINATELSAKGVELREVKHFVTLTDGVIEYEDVLASPGQLILIEEAELIGFPSTFAPRQALPLETVTFTSSFEVAVSELLPDRIIAPISVIFELFNNDTTITIGAELGEVSGSVTSHSFTIPAEFAETSFAARYTITFLDFGVEQVDSYEIPIPAVTIGALKPISMSSATALIPNSPFVNTSQSFTISTVLTNTSSVTVSDVVLKISSSGQSVFDPEVDIGTMSSGETRPVNIAVTAAGLSNDLEVFTINALASSGTNLQASTSLALTIQRPALLFLSAKLSPLSGSIAQKGAPLSLDLELINAGQAGIGDGTVSVSASGAGLNFDEQLVIGANSLSVDIGSPLTDGGAIIRAKITQLPMDLNTGEPALFFEPGDAEFVQSISVVSDLASARADVRLSSEEGILLGENRQLFEIELFNESLDDNARLEVQQMTVFFRDPSGFDIDPASILQLNQTTLADLEGNVISGRLISGSSLKIFFAPNTIDPGSSVKYALNAQIDSTTNLGGFRIILPLDEISILVTDGLQSGQRITPTAVSGAPPVTEQTYVLGASAFVESFGPMNNPFDPALGSNEYRFTLTEDTEMEFSIYSLIGDLVLREIYPAGSVGGSAGVQIVRWDGRNGDGDLVRNGVYVIRLVNVTTRETATLKQAVVR